MHGFVFTAILFLGLTLVLAVVPIVAASNITLDKGRGRLPGLILGFFLGWLGVLIAHLLKPRVEQYAPVTYRTCPKCKQQMRQDTSVCPHCRSESPTQALASDV